MVLRRSNPKAALADHLRSPHFDLSKVLELEREGAKINKKIVQRMYKNIASNIRTNTGQRRQGLISRFVSGSVEGIEKLLEIRSHTNVNPSEYLIQKVWKHALDELHLGSKDYNGRIYGGRFLEPNGLLIALEKLNVNFENVRPLESDVAKTYRKIWQYFLNDCSDFDLNKVIEASNSIANVSGVPIKDKSLIAKIFSAILRCEIYEYEDSFLSPDKYFEGSRPAMVRESYDLARETASKLNIRVPSSFMKEVIGQFTPYNLFKKILSDINQEGDEGFESIITLKQIVQGYYSSLVTKSSEISDTLERLSESSNTIDNIKLLGFKPGKKIWEQVFDRIASYSPQNHYSYIQGLVAKAADEQGFDLTDNSFVQGLYSKHYNRRFFTYFIRDVTGIEPKGAARDKIMFNELLKHISFTQKAKRFRDVVERYTKKANWAMQPQHVQELYGIANNQLRDRNNMPLKDYENLKINLTHLQFVTGVSPRLRYLRLAL